VLKTLLGKLTKKQPEARFSVEPTEQGLKFSLPPEAHDSIVKGQGGSWLMHQKIALSMLEEEGLAEKNNQSYLIPTQCAVSLESDVAQLLTLPDPFNGRFDTIIKGKTTSQEFSLTLIPHMKDGSKRTQYKLIGPYLAFGSLERYLLSPVQLLALSAVDQFHRLPASERTEHRNLNLVGTLQKAKKSGVDINLSHFNDLEIVSPEKIGVCGQEQSDGSLVLSPTFGTGESPDFMQKRIGQLDDAKEVGVIRAGKKVICLDQDMMAAASEVLSNRKIPKDLASSFIESPTAFLNAAKIDLDMGFSLRVKGAKRYSYKTFGSGPQTSQGWFDNEFDRTKSRVIEHLLKKHHSDYLLETIEEAKKQGAQSICIDGYNIDITEGIAEEIKALESVDSESLEAEEIEDCAPTSRSTLAVEQISGTYANLKVLAENSSYQGNIDPTSFKRVPLPHQNESIRWLLGLIQKATRQTNAEANLIQGAGLFDDMGLGKTMQCLSAAQQVVTNPDFNGLEDKPILVVAPLSLLDGWRKEVDDTFHKNPFIDIVTLQADADLKRFRLEGARSEINQSFDDNDLLDSGAIRYALKVGKEYGIERLDMPGRLILTTYETLRDYQFSLCRIGFSLVFLDEGQACKNPNTLQTRAAKALKADFKVAVTGTPIENALSDIWCLFDVVQPGLLGDWEHFRKTYIKPPKTKDIDPLSLRIILGRRLKTDIGPFMMRRMKDDELKGLPKKTVYTGAYCTDDDDHEYLADLGITMRGEQLHAYNSVLKLYNNAAPEQVLPLLHKLREASLHPGLNDDNIELMADTAKKAREIACTSVKMEATLKTLETIKAKNEKVIIFLTNKKLQRHMKSWLEQIFDIDVPIINGDTKARIYSINKQARKNAPPCRSEIIASFEKAEGFGIIILSPVAVGTGAIGRDPQYQGLAALTQQLQYPLRQQRVALADDVVAEQLV